MLTNVDLEGPVDPWTDGMGALKPVPEGVEVAVWVVTRSKRPGIDGFHDGRVRVRVASPPERGRANAEAAELLEKALRVPVSVSSGISSRSKTFVARGIGVREARERLGVEDA